MAIAFDSVGWEEGVSRLGISGRYQRRCKQTVLR